jgi:hypothetical protein
MSRTVEELRSIEHTAEELMQLSARERAIAMGADPDAIDDHGDDRRCHCGQPLRFDPHHEGETQGGNHLIGALRCDACGLALISKRARQGGGTWAVAKGSRSVVADGVKLRPEKGHTDQELAAVLHRIASLPQLEGALRAIVASADHGEAVRLARDVLDASLVPG